MISMICWTILFINFQSLILNPPFIFLSRQNFAWLPDGCFCVHISNFFRNFSIYSSIFCIWKEEIVSNVQTNSSKSDKQFRRYCTSKSKNHRTFFYYFPWKYELRTQKIITIKKIWFLSWNWIWRWLFFYLTAHIVAWYPILWNLGIMLNNVKVMDFRNGDV